jgi:hypothetical protein
MVIQTQGSRASQCAAVNVLLLQVSCRKERGVAAGGWQLQPCQDRQKPPHWGTPHLSPLVPCRLQQPTG